MENTKKLSPVNKLKHDAYLAKKFLIDNGVGCNTALMLEMLARLNGHANYQTALAAAKAEEKQYDPDAPGLIKDGSTYDYRLPAKQESVWVRVDNAAVHIIRSDEGVIADIWAEGIAVDSPHCSTYAFREELKEELLSDLAAGLDDAYEKIVTLCKERNIQVSEDSDQPGLWVWTSKNEGSDISFATEREAWVNAYEQAY